MRNAKNYTNMIFRRAERTQKFRKGRKPNKKHCRTQSSRARCDALNGWNPLLAGGQAAGGVSSRGDLTVGAVVC